jgi:hypothetical protein
MSLMEWIERLIKCETDKKNKRAIQTLTNIPSQPIVDEWSERKVYISDNEDRTQVVFSPPDHNKMRMQLKLFFLYKKKKKKKKKKFFFFFIFFFFFFFFFFFLNAFFRGKYDYEYFEYLAKVLHKCKEYGFKCFIDPHQDVVSLCQISSLVRWLL